jgi:hypothetical protein
MSTTTIAMLVDRIETLEKQMALLLKDTKVPNDDVKTKKEPKSKESKKKVKDETSSDDEDKPKKKRGPNGYILFSNAKRDEVKEQLTTGDEKPKNTEVMKQLAIMWSELGVEEKADWTAKAKASNDVA